MLKSVTSALAVTAMALLSSAGAAQTYSPAGSTIQVSASSVRLSKGSTVFTCALSGSGTISANGKTAQLNRLTFSGNFGVCSTIRFTGLPYFVAASSPTAASLTGVNVTSSLGTCAGNVSASFNQSNGQITFSNAVIPTSDNGGDCTITGVVATSPAASYTFP